MNGPTGESFYGQRQQFGQQQIHLWIYSLIIGVKKGMGQNLGTSHFSVISRLEQLERQAFCYPFIPSEFQKKSQDRDPMISSPMGSIHCFMSYPAS